MEILVSYVSTSPRGAPQRDQRRIPGSVFHVGRGTHCQIHLPDARVALVHARISIDEAGAVIDAGSQRIVYNDREVGGARLAVGDVMEVGPYVLIVEEPPAGVPLALSVRLSKRVSTKGSTALYRVLMKAPAHSKRRLSYVAFFGVLLLCLFAPIAADLVSVARLPLPEKTLAQTREAVHALAIGFVQVWNPGPLARGHLGLANECRACHEVPFVQVRDQACASCHSSIREHVPKVQLAGAVAFALDETRCAECHRDHKGRAMAPRSQQLCADCHANVAHANPQARAQNASDFATDHPQFRLSLVDAGQPKEVRRVRQRDPAAAPIVERSGLKFNHTLHLDPGGVRDPRARSRTVLGCDSCHQPDDRGARMRPVVMEKHCSGCHTLTFEPKVTRRQVPHGSLAEVETMLREFYSRLVLGDAPTDVVPPADLPRLRPGSVPSAEERQQALKAADEKARRALRELVQTRAVCSTCHHVSRSRQGAWRIAPVALTAAWMPAATFTHAKHNTQSCIGCHDVRTSRRAEDVTMPEIGRCRECHGGASAPAGKVASDCATCHRFHGGAALWR